MHAKNMDNNKNIRTITGIVYSGKKDHNGKVISVLIDSLDEDQEGYRVTPGKKANELLDLINKKIEVSCTISEDTRGDLSINVIDYTLFEES